MVCSGLPELNGLNHARELCMLALEVLRSCQQFRFKHLPNEKLQIRIGINSGPVTTGKVSLVFDEACYAYSSYLIRHPGLLSFTYCDCLCWRRLYVVEIGLSNNWGI